MPTGNPQVSQRLYQSQRAKRHELKLSYIKDAEPSADGKRSVRATETKNELIKAWEILLKHKELFADGNLNPILQIIQDITDTEFPPNSGKFKMVIYRKKAEELGRLPNFEGR